MRMFRDKIVRQMARMLRMQLLSLQKRLLIRGFLRFLARSVKKNKNAALLLWAAIVLGVGLTAFVASKWGVFDKGEATAKNVVRAADLTSNKSVSRSTLPVFPEEEKKEEKKLI